jgi:hypothetical protein
MRLLLLYLLLSFFRYFFSLILSGCFPSRRHETECRIWMESPLVDKACSHLVTTCRLSGSALSWDLMQMQSISFIQINRCFFLETLSRRCPRCTANSHAAAFQISLKMYHFGLGNFNFKFYLCRVLRKRKRDRPKVFRVGNATFTVTFIKRKHNIRFE